MRTCSRCTETKQDACFYARTDTRCVQCVGKDASKYLRELWWTEAAKTLGISGSWKNFSKAPPDHL